MAWGDAGTWGAVGEWGDAGGGTAAASRPGYAVKVELDADPSTAGIFVLDSSALDGTDVLAPDERWVEVPAGDVYAVSIRRGRQDDSREHDAGTCVLELRNDSGDYDPDNPDGRHVVFGERLLTVGTGVRVTLTPKAGGTACVAYQGRVADLACDHDPFRPTATLSCEDRLADLGRTPIPPMGEGSMSGDTTSDRASWLLDAAGVPAAYRDIAGSRSLLGWRGGGTARSQMERLARGEGGRCRVTRDGVLTLTEHAAEYAKPVAAVLSDTSGIGYRSLAVLPGPPNVVNVAIVTREGLDDVRAADSESVSVHGHREVSVDVALSDISDAESLADFHAHRRSVPTPVVAEVSPVLMGLPPERLEALAALDLGDLVRVERTTRDGRALAYEATVESMRWDLAPGGQSLSLSTAPSDTYGLHGSASWFELDSSALDGPAVLAPY